MPQYGLAFKSQFSNVKARIDTRLNKEDEIKRNFEQSDTKQNAQLNRNSSDVLVLNSKKDDGKILYI